MTHTVSSANGTRGKPYGLVFRSFYVRGRRVTRKVYARERDRDRSLPPYRIEDNQPQRDFPPVIAHAAPLHSLPHSAWHTAWQP